MSAKSVTRDDLIRRLNAAMVNSDISMTDPHLARDVIAALTDAPEHSTPREAPPAAAIQVTGSRVAKPLPRFAFSPHWAHGDAAGAGSDHIVRWVYDRQAQAIIAAEILEAGPSRDKPNEKLAWVEFDRSQWRDLRAVVLTNGFDCRLGKWDSDVSEAMDQDGLPQWAVDQLDREASANLQADFEEDDSARQARMVHR